MKTYKKYIVHPAGVEPEQLSELLWMLSDCDIEITNEELIYYPNDSIIEFKEILEEQLKKLVSEKEIAAFQIYTEEHDYINWNEEWEKSRNPIRLSSKIVVRPTFREYEAEENDVVVVIDPKMSFGTGEHETTKMMTQAIEENVKAGMEVIDVGTGTGVLAIVAVLLGADYALGIDNDEWCLLNGEENVALNNLNGKVDIKLGELACFEANERYDLVIANIQKNILLEIRDLLVKNCKPQGKVILSGLLNIDEEQMIKSFTSAGLTHLETKRLNEWIALIFVKP